MTEASLFIPLVIVAVVQMIKQASPKVQDWLTIGVALAVGIIVAIIDGPLGVTDISIAQGIVFALEAIGVSALAAKAGGGAAGDEKLR